MVAGAEAGAESDIRLSPYLVVEATARKPGADFNAPGLPGEWHRLDGVILVPVLPISRALENIQFVSRQGLPIVVIDRGASARKATQVFCNNFQGRFGAAQHLFGLEHLHIGVIGSGVEGALYKTRPGTGRFNGLLQVNRTNYQ
jgi:DNA-binding LacI/PurR family transcriptional regulator